MQKAASMASCMLVLFFPKLCLFLGCRHIASNFWNVNIHSLCNCVFLGSAFAQLVQQAQFAACAINTDGTKALSQTQNTKSVF